MRIYTIMSRRENASSTNANSEMMVNGLCVKSRFSTDRDHFMITTKLDKLDKEEVTLSEDHHTEIGHSKSGCRMHLVRTRVSG